jgi:hypothetical protein
MPKLACKCGEFISYSDIPSPFEWLLISDVDFDAFRGLVNAEDIYKTMTHALLCPRCKRLWILWNGFGELAEEYAPVPRSQDGDPSGQ